MGRARLPALLLFANANSRWNECDAEEEDDIIREEKEDIMITTSFR